MYEEYFLRSLSPMFSCSRRRLRNEAGFMLEVIHDHLPGKESVQLRKPSPGEPATDNQRWVYENSQFVSVVSKKSARKLVLECLVVDNGIGGATDGARGGEWRCGEWCPYLVCLCRLFQKHSSYAIQ